MRMDRFLRRHSFTKHAQPDCHFSGCSAVDRSSSGQFRVYAAMKGRTSPTSGRRRVSLWKRSDSIAARFRRWARRFGDQTLWHWQAAGFCRWLGVVAAS